MKLFHKFLFIVSLASIVLLMGLYVASIYTQRVLSQATLEHDRDNKERLEQAIAIASDLQVLFVRDYSTWDDMAIAAEAKNLEWIASEFYGPLEIYEADAVWVYGVDGQNLFSTISQEYTTPEVFNSLPPFFSKLSNISQDSVSSFFVVTKEQKLLAFHVGPILYHSQVEKNAQGPFGYVVVAVEWDAAFLQKTGKVLQASLAVAPGSTTQNTAAESSSYPLLSIEGKQIGVIDAVFEDESLQLLAQLVSWQFLFAIASVCMGLVLLAVLFNIMVIAPIQKLVSRMSGVLQKDMLKTKKRRSELEILHDLTTAYINELKKNTKLSQAVEAANDAIIITNKHGVIEYVNPAWELLNGYTESEALGKNPNIIKSGQTPKKVYEQLWKNLEVGERFTSDQVVNMRKDGSLYAAQISVFPVLSNGSVKHLVGISQDISQRKAREKLKSEFVSLASHQLRTPLTSIRWFSELLRKQLKKDMFADAFSSAKIIEQSTIRMSVLVNRLLNLSRIETGRLSIEPKSVNLRSFFSQMQKQAIIVAEKKGISLKFERTIATQSIIVDFDLLYEICTNLLTNAIKYTKKGGKIVFKAEVKQDFVHFSVSDTGIGIPKQEQQKIFQRFYRASNALNFDQQGTGLGLYLVKMLVERLGGTISFESTEGTGTIFSFVLPKKGVKQQGEIGVIRSDF